MLINPYRFTSYDDKILNLESLARANITKYKRKIYIIKKYDNMNNEESIFNSYMSCSIILINVSQNNDINNSFVNNIKSIYTFSAILPKDNLIDGFREARLILNGSASTGYSTIVEDLDMYIDLGMVLSYNHSTMPGPTQINLDDMYCDSIEMTRENLTTIDPRYYTKEHYEEDNGCEFISLPASGKNTFLGKELLDDSTTVYFIDKKQGYDDSVTYKRNKSSNLLVPVKSAFNADIIEQLGYVNSIPINLFQTTLESFLSSYKIIYDSSLGINIFNTTGPGFLNKEKKLAYLDLLKEDIKNIGDKLKRIYKDIRIIYIHSEYEDNINVSFYNEDVKSISVSTNKYDMLERVVVNLNVEDYEKSIEDRVIKYNNYHYAS